MGGLDWPAVTEVQSHDESRGGRSVTGVHKSVNRERNKSVTSGMEMLGVGTKV